jgi:hypothetical protein
MPRVFDLESGDIIAARCTYDSTSKNKTTYMGEFLYSRFIYHHKLNNSLKLSMIVTQDQLLAMRCAMCI